MLLESGRAISNFHVETDEDEPARMGCTALPAVAPKVRNAPTVNRESNFRIRTPYIDGNALARSVFNKMSAKATSVGTEKLLTPQEELRTYG